MPRVGVASVTARTRIEPGCQVRELLSEGRISQRRYDAYVALAAEMRESARTLDPDIVL